MSTPTQLDLTALDWSDGGEPFAALSGDGEGTGTLDVSAGGEPFVAAIVGVVAVSGSELSWPMITGEGTGSSPFSASEASLPIVTAAGTGTTGEAGYSALTLPMLTGTGAGNGPYFIPMLTGSGSGATGQVGRSAEAWPVLTGSATGDGGNTGTSTATLPALTGSGAGPNRSDMDLPMLTGAASGQAGTVGRSTVTLPALTADGTGDAPVVGASAWPLPLPVASGAGSTGAVGTSIVTLAALTLAAEGFSGTIGTSTLTLPILAGEGAGWIEVIGTSTLTLPAILAAGQGGPAPGATYSAYALNTERRALTTYSSLPIRGLAQFNGVYLAAGPGGLFVLGGDTDAGALINASARLAATDFGDPHLKRVEAMYVQYRTTGDLTLKVILNEHEQYDYTLPASGHETLAPQRVKIGKGAKAVYWQFDLSNRDGADFEFDSISVDPLVTSRKIG